MKYISTRGKKTNSKGFKDVLLSGLADDGGLFVPEVLPQFSTEKITALKTLNYAELTYEIIHPFVDGDIPRDVLKTAINDSYASFDHPAVAPLHQLDTNSWVLELFHGPTLAFKDFALQLLGRLLDYVLEENGQRAIVLGATSGDTGAAAIEGCRHSKHLDIFILHPYNRVSDVQRRQMTTVLAHNVHNIAIEGNFDDCQALVKQSFSDQSFLPEGLQLVAVNSINWTRIMAQVVYYFYAAIRLGAPHQAITFSVPTGNFGDVYAGFVAKGMGLPVEKLIVATNQNDILHRFFQNNDYSRKTLQPTLSPSMDIMVSSNFERLLFDLYDKKGDIISKLMAQFQENGQLPVNDKIWKRTKKLFASYSSDNNAICETIKILYQRTAYMADPHTATGFRASRAVSSTKVPTVTLATAHPVKFSHAILQAGLPVPALPESMSDLLTRTENYRLSGNSLHALKTDICSHIK